MKAYFRRKMPIHIMIRNNILCALLWNLNDVFNIFYLFNSYFEFIKCCCKKIIFHIVVYMNIFLLRRKANANQNLFFRIRVGTSSLCAFLPNSSISHFSFTRRQTINWFLYTIFGANTCTANGIFVSLNSICITRWPKKGLERYLDKKCCIETEKRGYEIAKCIFSNLKIYTCRILFNIDKFYGYRRVSRL